MKFSPLLKAEIRRLIVLWRRGCEEHQTLQSVSAQSSRRVAYLDENNSYGLTGLIDNIENAVTECELEFPSPK